jgi:hypothetical protein
MAYYYSLRIDAPIEKYKEIDSILGVKSNYPQAGWGLKLIEEDDDESIFFIKYFLSILDGKYEKLEKIGVKRKDITIWMLYAYDSQCNMEFSPEDMYNIGKENITLCVSCWDTHDYSESGE